VPGWTRKLALPVYLYWPYDELPPWEPGEPDEFGNVAAGRLVIWGDAYPAPREQTLLAESCANLCATDIVYCPLFAGEDHGPDAKPDPGGGFEDRLPPDIYEHNLALMRDFAPRVKAVLLGNLFGEWTGWQYPNKGTQFEQWQAEVRTRQFFWSAAELVRSAGGRPAFAPVPYDIRMDCLNGMNRLRNMILQLDALFVTFNGDDILEGLDASFREQQPEAWEQVKGRPTWRPCAEYFSPMTCVSGVDWGRILDGDWDERAARHGFKAMC